MSDIDAGPPSYHRAVGTQLRSIRRQKLLSLTDVELLSKQEFRASVLGAYERGERNVKIARLQRLARFYGVPADRLLPTDSADISSTHLPRSQSAARLTLDLAAIGRIGSERAERLVAFVRLLQVHRQDFNGQVMTVRKSDVYALAALLDVRVDQLGVELDRLGFRTRS